MFWRHDVPFRPSDVMTYILTSKYIIDVMTHYFTIITNFRRHHALFDVIKLFRPYDVYFNVITYFLKVFDVMTNYLTIVILLWPSKFLMSYMMYFMISWSIVSVLWRHNVTFTSWRTLWCHDVPSTQWGNFDLMMYFSTYFWRHDTLFNVRTCSEVMMLLGHCNMLFDLITYSSYFLM